MKRLALAIVLLCAVLPLVPFTQATAQTEKPKCDPGTVIKAANELKGSGDNQKDLAALVKLRDDISAANIACDGWSFKGEKDKVLGPIDLATGLYLITIKTSGYGAAEGKVLDGVCGNSEK